MADRGIFARIYRDNLWDYGSGPGSSEEYTRAYRAMLEQFLRANDIRSAIDIGCGDWQFSQLVDWHGARYTGYDVVPSVIEADRQKFAQTDVSFELMPNDYRDLAAADLALCKDVLQHLSLAHAEELLSILQQRARYVLITNCVLPEERLNLEIDDGDWRPLDIARDPFQRRPINLLAFGTKKMQLLVRGLD
ncbi:MAG: class I SAM-dependent methyltransferase [Rhodospirillales bacterium]